MLRKLFVLLAVLCSGLACNDETNQAQSDGLSENDDRGGNTETKIPCPAVNAASYGLQFVLPFRASNSGHQVTQGYEGSYSHSWSTKAPYTTFNDVCAVDLNGDAGDQIVAAAAGRIVMGESGKHVCKDGREVTGKGYGNHLYVDHGNGCRTHYAHLSTIIVRDANEVVQGQVLGAMGNTGCSTGDHLHFAMHCRNASGQWEPVRPEPISGLDTIAESKYLEYIGGFLPIMPVGTVLKTDASPDIYLVCSKKRLCRYENIEAYRSRRPWHYGTYETAQVVTVDASSIKQYAVGTAIAGQQQMKLVTCGSSAYLTMDGAGTSRRRIPYALASLNAAVLLKSWGVHPSEVMKGQAECSYPLQADLSLRPGTLIELASDNDFFVVTSAAYDGGLGHAEASVEVRRIKRLEKVCDQTGTPYVALLYGSYRNVLMIPDDAAFIMSGGKLGGSPDYSPDTGVVCSARPLGGSDTVPDAVSPVDSVPTTPAGPCAWHDHRCTTDLTASQTCTMNFEGDTQLGTEWTTFPCQPNEVCESASGRCVTKPPTPETTTPETTTLKPDATTPTVTEAWPSDPPHTLRCREGEGSLAVRVTGPVTDALMAAPTAPASLQYGSDADGWAVPYQSGKAEATWLGDSAAMVLKLPAAATHFNLYVEDADVATRDSWFDLNQRSDGTTPWTVVGDCHLGIREIVRGAATVVETTTTVTETIVTPPATTSVTPVTTDPPHTIRCTATATDLRVTVTGPILGSGLMADPTTPSALLWGSDTVGGWSVPYATGTGGGRTLTPWLGDDRTHELLMSLGADRFNLYVADAAASGQNAWFRLKAADGSPWTVLGDCQMGDGVLLRHP